MRPKQIDLVWVDPAKRAFCKRWLAARVSVAVYRAAVPWPLLEIKEVELSSGRADVESQGSVVSHAVMFKLGTGEAEAA